MVTLVPVFALVMLAVLHSVLGERLLIGPLLRSEPWPSLPLGRFVSQRTLRFAWHLTSVAWLGLAGAAWFGGRAGVLAAGAVLLVSAVMAFGFGRGRHFAWAFFLAGGLGALAAADLLPTSLGLVLGVVAAGALFALALLHVAWVLGLQWGLEAAVPRADGAPVFRPGPAVTLAVAGALAVAGVLALSLTGLGPTVPFAPALGVLAAVVFALRAVGDGRWVGLFKRVRGSRFAQLDDLVFTPVCVALSACFVFAVALG